MTLLNTLNANATLLATKLIMKQGESAGTQGFTNTINNMTEQTWNIIKAISSGIAMVAFAVIFLQMIFSSDAQTVARKKQQLLVVVIALVGIQCAQSIANWVVDIGNSVKSA